MASTNKGNIPILSSLTIFVLIDNCFPFHYRGRMGKRRRLTRPAAALPLYMAKHSKPPSTTATVPVTKREASLMR